jgi:hypothetical protein
MTTSPRASPSVSSAGGISLSSVPRAWSSARHGWPFCPGPGATFAPGPVYERGASASASSTSSASAPDATLLTPGSTWAGVRYASYARPVLGCSYPFGHLTAGIVMALSWSAGGEYGLGKIRTSAALAMILARLIRVSRAQHAQKCLYVEVTTNFRTVTLGVGGHVLMRRSVGTRCHDGSGRRRRPECPAAVAVMGRCHSPGRPGPLSVRCAVRARPGGISSGCPGRAARW